MRRVIILSAVLLAAGCNRNTNTNCHWIDGHQSRGLDLSGATDRRHLADDAQTAEDLAIRHADASRTLDWQRNVAEYHRVREECKARLNLIISEQHSVPVGAVRAAVAARRVWLDALVVAAFASLFAGVTMLATSFMLRGALVESRALAGVMLLMASLAAGGVGVLSGNVFVGVIESLRIGNGHMSYRVDRLPLRHRRLETFTAGALCFIAVGTVQFHRKRASKVRPYDSCGVRL